MLFKRLSNEKTRGIITFICVILITIIICGSSFFFIGRNVGYNKGTGEYRERTDQIIERIGEYRERERDRIDGTRVRLEQLKTTGSSTLERIKRLEEIHSILEDFYNRTLSEHSEFIISIGD